MKYGDTRFLLDCNEKQPLWRIFHLGETREAAEGFTFSWMTDDPQSSQMKKNEKKRNKKEIYL